MTRVVTNYEGVVVSGKWTWKEDPINPCLEFVSNTPILDKQDRRRRVKGHDGRGRGDGRASSGVQRQGSRGRVTASQKLHKSTLSKKEQSEHTKVTLDDIKSVSFERMSEVDTISVHFESLYRQEQLDFFLMYLLSYFNCFFKKLTLETQKNPMFIEPSTAEKLEYAESCERLKVAQKLLGRAYCILVLGLGSHEHHHMECGRSRVSKTYIDRSKYETLYSYCTFVVWITFHRKEFDIVKKEIGRLLRSDTFNPALRIKNAPSEVNELDQVKTPTKEETSEEKIGTEHNKNLNSVNIRHLHQKRPAILSIVNQRSPAVVSILPSPKEEAAWLFRRSDLNINENIPSILRNEDAEDAIDEKYSDLIIDFQNFKAGILGEPYKQFNPQTLSPLGAENEHDRNEAEDRDKGLSETENSKRDKNDSFDQGISRQQTAISQATTEAFTDDDEM